MGTCKLWCLKMIPCGLVLSPSQSLSWLLLAVANFKATGSARAKQRYLFRWRPLANHKDAQHNIETWIGCMQRLTIFLSHNIAWNHECSCTRCACSLARQGSHVSKQSNIHQSA